MFMLVAAEQLRHLVRRPRAASGVIGAEGLHRALNIEVPPGTRYQLYRALRAMSAGERMVVEHRIPDMNAHFDSAARRDEWLRCLRSPDGSQDTEEVDPVLVPGTAFPWVIGKILLRCGWCAPSDQPHWVPNLRFFLLTELGQTSFLRAQNWWLERTAIERLQLMFME